MQRSFLVIAVAIVGAATVTTPVFSPAQRAANAIERALTFAGGRQAVAELRGIRVNFVRIGFGAGQEEWPGAVEPIASTTDGSEAIDFDRQRLWRRYHIANASPVFQCAMLPDSSGFMRDTVSSGSCGGINGYANATRNDPIPILRSIARAAGAPVRNLPGKVVQQRKAAGAEVQLSGDTIRVWVDEETGQPLALERVQDSPVSGTSTTQISMASWIAVGGLRLPATVAITVAGQPAGFLRLGQLELNPSTDSLFNSVVKVAFRSPGTAAAIVELAPGLYRREGASHVPHIALVGDSIVVLDAPLGDDFMHDVLDSLRLRFPSTPVKAFVVSHHHNDHVSGVRAAFGAGLAAISSARIADYVRAVGVRSGERVPGNRRVTRVADTLAVGSGPARFVLYHVPSTHAQGLLAAYFPETGILWDPDLLSTGTPAARREIYDFVQARRLAVKQITPAHGRPVSWENFLKSVPGLQG